MALTFFGVLSHTLQVTTQVLKAVRNPGGISTTGLASFPFARRYLGNRFFFLLLLLLRCFSSQRSLPYAMDSRMDT